MKSEIMYKMDLIDDIMRTLDLQGSLYFRTHFTPPWAVTVPEYEHAARFHLVVQGTCHVVIGDSAHICLGPGDMVLIPNGCPHVLSDDGSVAAPLLETVLESAGYDGQGVLVLGEGDRNAATQLICGHFSFRHRSNHPIMDALPAYVHVRVSDRSTEPWLDDTLRMISRRIFSGTLGATASVTRLSEIVFIEVLRSGLAESDQLKSIIAAFNDGQISSALKAMHIDPSASWTVQSLARLVGMSRSRFSDRFSDLMGVSPMSYLTSWRLQKSLELLDQSQCSIQEVSSRTGYQSPAAFSRAFSSRFEISPKAYRQQIAQ